MRTWYLDTWGPMKTDDTIDLGALEHALEVARPEYENARGVYRAAQDRLVDANDRLNATQAAMSRALAKLKDGP